MKLKKGIFIVFEGPEGSGKSTHCNMLKKYLENKGYEVILTREPGGTKVAEHVRKIILSPETKISALTELLLYESARAQHVAEVIKPNLKENKIVISDRFADASIAYQGYGRGLSIPMIQKLNKIATMGIKPDLTILLDIHPEEGLKRVKATRNKFDRLEQEDIEFHKKIRLGYLKIAKQRKDYVIIDVTNKTKQEVHKKIISIINQRLKLNV